MKERYKTFKQQTREQREYRKALKQLHRVWFHDEPPYIDTPVR